VIDRSACGVGSPCICCIFST